MFSSINYFRMFHLVLVYSLIEYNVIVWHPYLAKDQLRIEHVQNKLITLATTTPFYEEHTFQPLPLTILMLTFVLFLLCSVAL